MSEGINLRLSVDDILDLMAERDRLRDALQMLYDTHCAPYGGDKAAMYPQALELAEKALREVKG